MMKQTKSPHLSDVHTYLVGIQYNNPFTSNSSFFEIQRRVEMIELAVEVSEYLQHGKQSNPAFPSHANAQVWYCWSMNHPDDGDAYHELMDAIEKLKSLNTAA